ncbi:DUF748 domain-containing protein [Marinobacter sp. 71-i]|uniref:DUF748 domain-containing protein n=1 Tax=Marinobacter iranensis TaxID=2962607 RepID=A0ABT5YD08_9GAMM|nr:DUF748 domain-containing protein [Marinobacter iranensis]MDF0751577.1 DUF748 domain-containing protein [Marinobacter iranensis]
MVESRTRKLSARNISVAVLVLVVIYALAGFVVLPWWLERALPERLEQHMGWQAEIEDIRVNPFVMSVEALNLKASDSEGEPVVAFDSLYANLGVWRLITGVVALQNIELEEPYIRLDLLEDYSVNYARDWQANNPAGEEQPAADEPDSGEPVRLYFDRVRVSGGELLFRDFSQQGQEAFRVTPLDLALNDLATWPRDDAESNYYLLAAVGSQTIEWEGDLSISPLYSQGFIKLGDVSHETLQHFLKPYLPYHLRSGSVTLSSQYELQSPGEFFLTTSDGQVTIENVDLGLEANSEESLFSADSLSVGDISFGLNNREASTGTVNIDGMNLALHRDQNGQINLLAPFQEGTDGPQDDEGGSGAPFRWSVAGVELGNSQVTWRDDQPQTSAELALEDLSVSIDQISHRLEDPVNYSANASLNGGGKLSINGQATLTPFTLEAGISGTEIALAQFGTYVSEAVNLDVRDGLLTVDGNLDLDQQKEPLTGTFSGTGEVSALDLRLGDNDAPLIQWESMRLQPVEYNVAPARLEIGTITLAGPSVNVVRQGSGVHNIERIVRDSSSEGEASAGDENTNGGEPEFIFRIGQLMLEEGAVSYTDRTLDPAFATRIDQLRGSVTGLSNVAPQQGQLSMQGRVGDVASMTLNGSVGTLGTEETSDLKLAMEGVSLPMLSPYFGRYLGYSVDSGKLNLDLDYEFSGSRLDAANSVVLKQLELGAPVPSDEAVSAPVKLGLALLRDRQGVIDINLPISGDLDNPDFSVGQVVMRAFVNLVAKAATSPFSMLGSIADLAGLSGEELGRVSFEAGRTELAEGEDVKLETLGKALNDRPGLALNVRGAVAPQADGNALRRQKLFEDLGIADADSASERITRLERAYENSDYVASINEFRNDVAGNNGEPGEQEWEQALVERLIATIELPPEALGNLATSRGVWLREQMLEEYDVPANQIYLLDPVRDASANDEGKVTISFELDAR